MTLDAKQPSLRSSNRYATAEEKWLSRAVLSLFLIMQTLVVTPSVGQSMSDQHHIWRILHASPYLRRSGRRCIVPLGLDRHFMLDRHGIKDNGSVPNLPATCCDFG